MSTDLANSTNLTTKRADVGVGNIYYQHAGEGSPVILIHGLSASGRWWSKNVPALAVRHRVYVIDLIGFGRSSRMGRFHLAEAAEGLSRWLDQSGISRVSVVGHSMGGYIVAQLAADDPERVDRLVLVDAAIGLPSLGRLRYAALLIRSTATLPLRTLPIVLTDAYRAGPRTIWHAADELMSGDLGETIARIHAPALVIWGERDTLVPIEVGRQLVERLPSARLAVIPRAGHNPMVDRPDAFNQLVEAFLDEEIVTGAGGPVHPVNLIG